MKYIIRVDKDTGCSHNMIFLFSTYTIANLYVFKLELKLSLPLLVLS